MSSYTIFRELMMHLPTPIEEQHLEILDDVEDCHRAWVALAKSAISQSDMLIRFEVLSREYNDLNAAHQNCDRSVRKNFIFLVSSPRI